MRYILFTLPHCPKCPTVVDFLDLQGISFEQIDASDAKNEDIVQKYGIGTVPTLVVLNQGKIVDMASGFEDIQALIEHS